MKVVDLRALYEKLSSLWPSHLEQFLSPLEAVVRADQFYRAHFPEPGKPVSLLVLSESPARTPPELLQLQMSPEIAKKFGIRENETNHLNLVHCLSYGEPWTLEGQEDNYNGSTKKTQGVRTRKIIRREKLNSMIRDRLSTGTPAFWRVLATLAGDLDADEDNSDPMKNIGQNPKDFKKAFCHVNGGGSKDKQVREARLASKVRVLRKMRERGIVFLDISPLPLYLASGTIIKKNKKTGREYFTPAHKLPERAYKSIIQTSFADYVAPILNQLEPENVLILGEKLEQAISEKVMKASLPKQSHYRGCLKHPSYNRAQGVKYVPYLQKLRECSSSMDLNDL